MSRPLLVPLVFGAMALLACSGAGDEAAAPKADARSESAPRETKAAAKKATYNGRFASDPKLGPWDVAALVGEDLRIVRNEIYARHGRPFQTADMKAHFEAQPWYTEDPAYSDARLTANDKANAALIQSFEPDGQNPVKVGEFSGETGLMFVDKQTAVIIEGSDMYEATRTERRWKGMGDWVVTWSDTGDWAQSGDRQLWKLDHKKHRVVSVVEAD